MKRKVDMKEMRWVNPPHHYVVKKNCVIMETDPYTNLWAQTYWKITQQNAHAFVFDIEDEFTFTMRMDFRFNEHYDQAGMIIWANDDNWFKIGMEYVDKEHSYLGTTVTYHGFSDYSSREIASGMSSMYFRLSHRDEDFKVENSFDGVRFRQMRMFHLKNRTGKFSVGIYACSPLDSSFDVTFSEMTLEPCIWEQKEPTVK
ncbi:MAG: DUF1349 domain-containing protein [Erysipelotrichaceae bacterium]|nr:DUF1349 domain-containing protein [Erysipelotrichaceae bacterium]